MGFLDKVNNLVETIKNAVSGGSSSNESSAHSSGGGTSSDAARSAAQAAAAKYQADGQKRTASTKSPTNNVLVDSVKHTPTSSGRTYSGTGTKAQNPEKAQNKAAAQTAADIAQQRGQSRTNYLKTYKTEESNYQAPKYKSSEDLNGARANAYDPADRYIAQAEGARNSTVDYMTGAERKAAEKASKRPKNYLSEADYRQMDINDAYSPNWTDDKRLKETNGFQSVDDIADWGKNVVKAVGTSVGGSFLSNTGAAYEAGNGTDSWRTQEAVAQMNDAYQQALRVAVEQMNSADPDSYSDQLDAAKRELLAYAATIGNGMAEQVESNLTSAINQMKADPHNDHLFEYLLNNGNSGTLPDTTTFQGAALATRDMAREMFGQSQGYTEAAKAAAGNTTAGNILTDVAINLAEQGIDAAVGFLGSMGAAPQIASKVYQSISLGNMALRVFGQTASQVRDEGGNFGQQTFEAGLAAGVEVLTEKMSGGIAKFYGKGDTDEIVEEIARRVTQSDFGRSVIRTIGGMTGEAVEEVISTVVDPVVRAVHDAEATDKYATVEGRQELATEAGYSALVAALAALAGSSATYINGSNAQANAALTQTDQIQAELESNGMSTKDARKVAPNVQKYQSEGFEGLSKSEQKTLTNPLIRSIYGIDIELDSATDTINKQTDGKRVKPAQVAAAEKTMSDRLTPEIFAEYKKFNDESQTRETVMAAADAFNNELFDAAEGDVILDQNNRPVGRVKTVNDYGITIQYNDGSTESAVFMGNNGLLDPNSNLAKVFNDGGGVVAQEDADIIIRNAEQERKAQIKAGEEMQDRGEKAQPQTPQPPKADTPAPHKAPTPAKAQPAQQQTTQQETPKQEAPKEPQFQNQDVYDNNKYEVEQSANGYYVKQPDGGLVGPFETYGQAMGMVSQLSQQNQAPQIQEESQPEATQEQEAPSEPETPPSRSPLTDSVTEANTVTENNGTPSKAEQYFADNPKKTTYQTTYKEAGVKIKKNADGTFTVSMASPKKNGKGWTKGVSVIGTVNSISEANQLVVDEYSKKSAPKALTDSATGTPIESPQNASQGVSQEEGNSVLPNEQNASEVQNDELNSKPEAESGADLSKLPKWEQETYDRIKDRIPTWRDDQLTPMGDDFDRQNYSDELISAVNELIEQEQAKRKAEKDAQERAENQRLDRLEKADADIFAALKENPNTDISALEQEYRAAASDFGWSEAFTNERFQDLKGRAASDSFLQYLEDHGFKIGGGQDVSALRAAWEEEYYGQKAETENLPQNPLVQNKATKETETESTSTKEADLPKNPFVQTEAETEEQPQNSLVQTEEKTKNPLEPTPEAISQASLDYNIIEDYDFEERQQALAELSLEQIAALYRYAQNLQNLPENYGQYPNASFGMAIEEAYHDALRKYQDENVEQMRQENLGNKGANKNPQKYSDYQTPVNEDSTGKPLTQGQANFFSKSTLRDALGRLIRFFHGTGNLGHTSYDFSYADDGRTLWLSNSKDVTSSYSGAVNEDGYLDGRTMGASNAPVYVNMENPFILDGQGSLWNQIEITDDIASVLEQLGYSFDRSEPLFYGDDGTGKYANTRELAAYAYAMGYDGIVIKNIIDYGPAEIEVNRYAPADILAVFSSNQVKDVKNENPTKSDDYRYKERLSDEAELARLEGGKDTTEDTEVSKKRRKALNEYGSKFDIRARGKALANRLIDIALGSPAELNSTNAFELNTVSGAVIMPRDWQHNKHSDQRAGTKTSKDAQVYEESLDPNTRENRNKREGAFYNALREAAEDFGEDTTLESLTHNKAKSYGDVLEYLGLSEKATLGQIMDQIEVRAADQESENKEYTEYGFEYGPEVAPKISDDEAAEILELAGEYLAEQDEYVKSQSNGEEQNETVSVASDDAAQATEAGDYGIFTVRYDSDQDIARADEETAGQGYDWKLVAEFMADTTNAYGSPADRIEYLKQYFPDHEFRVSEDGTHVEEVFGFREYNPFIGDQSATKEELDWWNEHAMEFIEDKFGDSMTDQNGKSVYSEHSFIPEVLAEVRDKDGNIVKKRRRNPSAGYERADGTKGNLTSILARGTTLDYNGKRYLFRVGQGYFRHIVSTNIQKGVKQVINRHTQRVEQLRSQIAKVEKEYNNWLQNPLDPSKSIREQSNKVELNYEQRLDELRTQLKAEERWLAKLEYDPETKQNYSLLTFMKFDRSGVVTKEDRDTIAKYIPYGDTSMDDLGFKSLQNAASEEFARQLIDSIYEEGTHGVDIARNSRNAKTSQERTRWRQTGSELDVAAAEGRLPQWNSATERFDRAGESVTRGASSVTGLSAYDETGTQTTSAGQELSSVRGSSGSGQIMDDQGTVRQVYGPQRADRSADRRGTTPERASRNAARVTNDLNQAWEESVTLQKKGGRPGSTISAKQLDNNTFLDGEASGQIDPSKYVDKKGKPTRLQSVAQAILDAARDFGVSVVQIKGRFIRTHEDGNGGQYTTEPVALADLNEGYIAVSELTEKNQKEVTLDSVHEITHAVTESIFGSDEERLVNFIRGIAKASGVNIEAKSRKVAALYAEDGVSFTGSVANEIISRIAEGDDCGGMFTQSEMEAIQDALFDTQEFRNGISHSQAYMDLLEYSRSQLRNKAAPQDSGRNRVGTDVGYTPSAEPQEGRISNIIQAQRGTESQQTREEKRTALAINVAVAIQNNDFARAQQLINEAGTTQQRDSGLYSDEMVGMYRRAAQGEGRVPSNLRMKEDLDQYSDESFDALVNDTSYEEASAINGQNYDQYDLNSEFNAEQASETETLNNMSGRGVDTTSAPIENFQNAEQVSENAAMEDLSGTGVDTERTPIDYFQSQEQASESDLIREQSRNDLTGSEDTNFESPYEAEQRTEQEAMDSLYENMDGRKLTSPKRTANDYYGSAYARVQETQKKHKRNKARSSFSIAELYYKTYGETNDSIRNFKRLQKLNSNVDSLLDGKMSYYDFNSFAKNMSSRQGIGQILNDDIQSELDTVVALEEAAQDKNASEQDVVDFQYAAANVVSHIVARMDMVEKTERARARLDTAAKKHGAKGGRKNLVGTALDAWNRYQITGDNFWRMMDDWAGKGQGYSYAREHLKTIATRISEEAKLKGYFALEGVDRKSKEFKDFVDGTSMSNVDFDGHKISLMEGIKFVKTVDTLRKFASKNGRPNWQRVAALGGFTFEGKNGKPIFVDIQGSYDNNAEARVEWVEQRYNQLKQEIANNKAASAYMSAVEEMYYEASKDAEKVHSKVNGYDRYMYGKGWYTDIHYAKKGDGTVDFRYSDRDATDVHDTASMQRRTKVAGGYAIINPMSRSVDAYISQISNYIAFEEFGQKLGVLSDSKSINGSYANTIRDAYGDQYAQWFDNYVKTMTLYKENKPKGGMNSALAKARQAMMSGALIGSVSVPIKQVSSFFDTMGMLDPRAVAAVFVQNPLGRKQKGIKNYLMDSRNQSISDPDLAELFGDKGILRKIKDTRIGKLAISATNMMDATAVSNVYRACVLDVEYNNPLGKGIYNNGKNFKDGLTPDGQFYVDAKFEEALLGSQPIFTPQARNELARTDNQFARMFSTFRTQQTQNYNRMLQTWNEYQAARKNDGDTKETGKKFVQTMTGQMIASASLSALTAIANTILHKHRRYKDDDDELDEEKFWQRFGLGAFESLMGNSLFVGDITKWAIDLYNSQNDPNWNWKYSTKESQYFDAIEGMHIPIPASGAIGTAIQALNSAINLYRDVDENGWSDQNKLSARYLAGNIATAFGVQLNNVYYALNAGYQWYMDAAQFVTGNKKYEQKYDDIFTQIVKVDYSQQNRLVNSILAGKTQKVADMFDDMGQDKFENAVYYGAFDQYKAGKIDKAEYVELLMNFAGKSYKEASNEVEKKSRLLESGISQYNGIDGRDGRKAFYAQYSGNFQSRDAYKQFFEDVKNGKAEGKHNTYYTQWYGQPQEVSANQSSIIDTMNRNIQAGNFSYETAKLLWENYYGYSTGKYSAWKFVGK